MPSTVCSSPHLLVRQFFIYGVLKNDLFSYFITFRIRKYRILYKSEEFISSFHYFGTIMSGICSIMQSCFFILRQLFGEEPLDFQEGQVFFLFSKNCSKGKGEEQIFQIYRHAEWKPYYWWERCITLPLQSLRENPLLQTLVPSHLIWIFIEFFLYYVSKLDVFI